MTILRRLLSMGLTLVLLVRCASQEAPPTTMSLRGAWVQSKSVLTRADIDAVIQRAEDGGFRQVFVGVFEAGRTIFPSAVAEQNLDVEPGFDPLMYMVEHAHKKDIEVHAWFVVGRVANSKGDSVVIEKHPDWGLVGPDGQTMAWLNFTHPEARTFISDIMMETVERGVDGIHFDYTRYPDSEWGFDEYSISAFNSQHDFDLNELRYTDLPAYGQFEGNGLLQPTTAQVLARFSNGMPAVLLNEYGDGKALILNWKAGQRATAVGTGILQRAINTFSREGDTVYILRSETTIAEYGSQSLDTVVAWVDSLGWEYAEISSEGMEELAPGSVLILPYVYLFSDSEAERLARLVSSGGSAIFIDGPTRSMNRDELRAVTGMLPLRNYFKGWLQMTASTDHPLLPVSGRPDDIELYETRNEQWFDFREAGINSLLQEVYQRVKETNADVLVSVTITSDQVQAKWDSLQDWQTWLDERYIDALIPRAYEDTTDELRITLHEWSPFSGKYGRLTYGLIAYVEDDGDPFSKSPEQLIAEIRLVAASGSNGYMVFDLDRMSEAQLDMLASIE